MSIRAYKTSKERRKTKVRSKINGTSERPRISVFRSNKYNYVQVIDDVKGRVIASASVKSEKLNIKKSKSDSAYELGKIISEKLKKLKIDKVVFDRGSYKYHGRVKKISDGIRDGSIKV